MDRERARSVFENIVRNALESGGPEERISAGIIRRSARTANARIGGARGRTLIVISILDRGRGILPEDLDRVFDPFFTRKSAGTGIGLSISKRFVEGAGGTITLERREGGGTAVRIVLPEYAGGGQ
jgi:signal transduction histidine kinase